MGVLGFSFGFVLYFCGFWILVFFICEIGILSLVLFCFKVVGRVRSWDVCDGKIIGMGVDFI